MHNRGFCSTDIGASRAGIVRAIITCKAGNKTESVREREKSRWAK